MKYIAFEGADGVGKTAVVQQLLKKYPKKLHIINKCNIDSHLEMVSPEYLDVTSDRIKFFLYLAEHSYYDEQQRALLDGGKIVISDRSIYSLPAYTQAYNYELGFSTAYKKML